MTADPAVPMMSTVVLCAVLALMVAAIHNEALRLLNLVLLPRIARPRRWHVGGTVLVLIVIHVLEVIVYATGMYGTGLYWPDAQALTNTSSIDFMTYVYFSFSCYTSLGIGDLQPLGHLRLVAGTEALVGLLMIGWTASFLLLEMRELWAMRKRDREA